MRSGVLGRFLLRVIGVIGPGFGTMGSAVPRPVNILVGMSLGRARPRRVLLVAGSVADTFEARRVSDRRRWRWRCLVSFVERERVTVESKALAIPVGSNEDIYPLTAASCWIVFDGSVKDGDRSRVRERLYANRAIESSGPNRSATYSLAYVSLSVLLLSMSFDATYSARYTDGRPVIYGIANKFNVTGNAYDRTIIATSYEDLVPVQQRDPRCRSRSIAKSKCVEDWYSERLIGCQTVSLISPAKSCSIKEYERTNRGNVRSLTHGGTGERFETIYSHASLDRSRSRNSGIREHFYNCKTREDGTIRIISIYKKFPKKFLKIRYYKIRYRLKEIVREYELKIGWKVAYPLSFL